MRLNIQGILLNDMGGNWSVYYKDVDSLSKFPSDWHLTDANRCCIYVCVCVYVCMCVCVCGRGFWNTYELLNLKALKIAICYENRMFQCMGKIFCVQLQRYPLKFQTKCLPPAPFRTMTSLYTLSVIRSPLFSVIVHFRFWLTVQLTY